MKRLPGSTSSILYEVKTDNSTIVLRQFDNEEWLLEEPDLVQHEAASLQHASASGLPAPSLIAFDETGEASGLPSVLMTKVEGKVELLPDDFNKWTDGLAKILAAIHRITANDFPWVYASYTNRDESKSRNGRRNEICGRLHLTDYTRRQPEFRETFIHRDFHPTNVLWLDNEVSRIVDWPTHVAVQGVRRGSLPGESRVVV